METELNTNVNPGPATSENPYLSLASHAGPDPKSNPYYALKGGQDAVGNAPEPDKPTEYSKFLRIRQGQAEADKNYRNANSFGAYAGALVNPLTYAHGAFDLVKSLVTHPIKTVKAATGGLISGVTLGGADAASKYITDNADKLGVGKDTAKSIADFLHPDPTNNTLSGINSGFNFAGQAAPYIATDGAIAAGMKYAAPKFVAEHAGLAKWVSEVAGFNALGQTQEAFNGSDVQDRMKRAGIDTAAASLFPVAGKIYSGIKNTLFKTAVEKSEPYIAGVADSATKNTAEAAAASEPKPGTMSDIVPNNAAVDLSGRTSSKPLGPQNNVDGILRPKIALTVPEKVVDSGAGKEGTAKIITNDAEALKNYIKGSSDINYKQVKTLGKDANGDAIMARHEFDPRTGMHTIYTTDATTASSLAHELGHYFDSKLTSEAGKLSTMLPAAAKNPEAFRETLASYAVKLLDGNATGEQVSAKIAEIAGTMQKEIDTLSAARRGGTAASSNSEKFADAVSQLYTENGKEFNKAPILSGFLEQANATKDATSIFGRKIATAAKASAEIAKPVKGVAKAVVAEARQAASADDFVKSRFDGEGFRPAEKGEMIPSGYEQKTNSYGKLFTNAPLSETAETKLRQTYETATAGVKENIEKMKSVAEPGEPVAKDLKRIPTGRQPATIPIKAGNITKDVDAEVFINTRILPKITGVERIAKSNAEIISRAMESAMTEKDFNDILTTRFGNLSEDVLKAKQFMTDGAVALSERLAGRDIADIPAQEAKDILSQYNRIVQTFEVFSGVRTELSNSFRTLGLAVNPGENDTLAQALESIQKTIGDEKDPFKIVQGLMKAQETNIVEKYFKVWYPAMLSGPKTAIRNFLGNAAGITMETFSSLFTKEGRQEFGARVLGMIDAQKDAINYATRVFKGQETVYSKFYDPATPVARSFKGLDAFFSYVGGSLEGVDAYFSKVYQSGEVAAARVGNETFGLQSKELIEGIYDATAKVKGQMATFRNPLEKTAVGQGASIVQSLKKSDSKTVVAIGNFFAPFVRTIANITDRQLDFMPILNLARTFDFSIPMTGLKTGARELMEARAERVLAQAGFKESIMAEAKNSGLGALETRQYLADETARVKDILVEKFRTQQLGRFYTGLAVTGAALPLVINNRITGNGPADANQKALLMQTGWRPNSIILPDGTALPYNNLLLPFSMILSVMGNINDSIQYRSDKVDLQTKIIDGFAGFMKSEVDQSFLSGIASLFDTISGNKSPTQFFNEFVTNGIPIPAAWTQTKDILFPERYNATTFNETLRNKLGITGEAFGMPALTPNLDALGNQKKADLIYGTLPQFGGQFKDDPVYGFMADHDAFVGKPSKSLVIKGNQKGESRAITPEEYTQYVEDSGKEIYAKLNSEIAAGYFNKFSTKQEVKDAIDGIAQRIRTKYKAKINY